MHRFQLYFFNMDISLIMTFTRLKFVVHAYETHFEGKVSQNFDIFLSFCFIVCRRSHLRKKMKKSQKLPVFCHKIKSRT